MTAMVTLGPALRRQRGAIRMLLITALLMATFFMFLLVDLSRTAARRAELQIAVDGAAMAAAVALKATPNAYAAATTAAGQGMNTYNYRTGSSKQIKLPASAVKFGVTEHGQWYPSTTTVPGLRYVQVNSGATEELYGKVDMLLLTGLPAITHGTAAPSHVMVSAVAVAGPLNTSIGLRQ